MGLTFEQNCEPLLRDSQKNGNVSNNSSELESTITPENFCTEIAKLNITRQVDQGWLTHHYENKGKNAAVFWLTGEKKILRITYNNDFKDDEHRGLYYQGIIANECNFVNKVLDLGTYQNPGEKIKIGKEKPITIKKGTTGVYAILEDLPFSFRKFIEYTSTRKSLRYNGIVQFLQACVCIHKMRYVHLDLKPENIRFDASYNLNIIDFGYCSVIGTSINRDEQGSIGYKSPMYTEEYAETGFFSKFLDYYAIGVIIVQFVHGETDVEKIYRNDYKDKKPSGKRYLN